MRSTDQYLALVINEHADKPKFMAELRALVDPFAQMQSFLADMPRYFDLDSPACVGAQLDILGAFIGVSRNIGAPVTNTWFMLDKTAHGLDQGVWKSPYKTEYYTTVLDDVSYKKLLRARIASNHWDGTLVSAQSILNSFFTGAGNNVFLQDGNAVFVDAFFALDDSTRGLDSSYHLRGPFFEDPGSSDPSVIFCMAGIIPSLPYIFLFYQNHIPLVGAGVRAEFCIATKDNSKLFALDIANGSMAGLDSGVFGASVDYISTYGFVP